MQRKKKSASARAKAKVKVIKFVSNDEQMNSSERELQRDAQLNEPEIMSEISNWEQMLAKTKAQVSNSLQEKNKEIHLLKQELNKLKTYINAKEKFLAEQKTKETITEQNLQEQTLRKEKLAEQITKLTELLKIKLNENEKLHEYTEQINKANETLLDENQQIKLKLLQTIKELKWQKQQEPTQQGQLLQEQDKIIAYFEQLQKTEQIKDAETKSNAYRKLLLAKTKEFEQSIAEKDEIILQLQKKNINQLPEQIQERAKQKIEPAEIKETFTKMHDNEQIEELQQELNKYKLHLLAKIKENRQLRQQIQEIHQQVGLVSNKTIAFEQELTAKKQQVHELAEELDAAKKKYHESEQARLQALQQIEPLQDELKRIREGLLFRMKQEKDLLQKAKQLQLANQEAEEKIAWLQNTIDADKQQKEKQKQEEIFENEKINILEQANKELLKKIEALETENKSIAQEADKLQEELAKKDEYYPYAINLSKLEKEEEIKKVMKESLKRELELKLDVEKLKRIVNDQQFIIKQLKSDERETLLELHEKFKEVFTRKRETISRAEAGILKEKAEKIRK